MASLRWAADDTLRYKMRVPKPLLQDIYGLAVTTGISDQGTVLRVAAFAWPPVYCNNLVSLV